MIKRFIWHDQNEDSSVYLYHYETSRYYNPKWDDWYYMLPCYFEQETLNGNYLVLED